MPDEHGGVVKENYLWKVHIFFVHCYIVYIQAGTHAVVYCYTYTTNKC